MDEALTGNSRPPVRILRRSRQVIDLNDLPIPRDARAEATWPTFMLEMAEHIGAYDTLLIVDALGGRDFVVAVNPARGRFPAIVGTEKSAILSHVYGRSRVTIPLGTEALRKARSAPVLAAVRLGRMSIKEAAALLRMRRAHLSRLINHTDEGAGYEPIVLPEPRILVALRRAAAIISEVLASVGCSDELIGETTARVLDIWFNPSAQPIGANHDQTEE